MSKLAEYIGAGCCGVIPTLLTGYDAFHSWQWWAMAMPLLVVWNVVVYHSRKEK